MSQQVTLTCTLLATEVSNYSLCAAKMINSSTQIRDNYKGKKQPYTPEYIKLRNYVANYIKDSKKTLNTGKNTIAIPLINLKNALNTNEYLSGTLLDINQPTKEINHKKISTGKTKVIPQGYNPNEKVHWLRKIIDLYDVNEARNFELVLRKNCEKYDLNLNLIIAIIKHETFDTFCTKMPNHQIETGNPDKIKSAGRLMGNVCDEIISSYANLKNMNKDQYLLKLMDASFYNEIKNTEGIFFPYAFGLIQFTGLYGFDPSNRRFGRNISILDIYNASLSTQIQYAIEYIIGTAADKKATLNSQTIYALILFPSLFGKQSVAVPSGNKPADKNKNGVLDWDDIEKLIIDDYFSKEAVNEAYSFFL